LVAIPGSTEIQGRGDGSQINIFGIGETTYYVT